MNTKECKSYFSQDDFSGLLDENSGPVVDELTAHLEVCEHCQLHLKNLSAEPSWWHRAHTSLDSFDFNHEDTIPDSQPPIRFINGEVRLNHQEEAKSSDDYLGAILKSPSHPEMLGRLDGFDIEEKIGQGGMGIVLKAFDHSLNRTVALKVMSPHLVTNPEANQRFHREAKAAAAVAHPNIVPIFQISDEADHPYIAMEFVDGLSLQDYVTKNGPLGLVDIVRIAFQIADGLAAAHCTGLIHRDIKPANIMLEKNLSRVLITDFGLARAADEVMLTQSSCLAGTPNYMSPEQVLNQPIDERTDLFSLGLVMHFLACGKEKFQGDNAFAVIQQIANPTRQYNGEPLKRLPKELSRIIDRLLEKKVADRIQSAADLKELLGRYLAHLQAPENNKLPKVSIPPTKKRIMSRWIGSLILLGVISTFLGIGLNYLAVPDKHGTKHESADHESADHESTEHGNPKHGHGDENHENAEHDEN